MFLPVVKYMKSKKKSDIFWFVYYLSAIYKVKLNWYLPNVNVKDIANLLLNKLQKDFFNYLLVIKSYDYFKILW